MPKTHRSADPTNVLNRREFGRGAVAASVASTVVGSAVLADEYPVPREPTSETLVQQLHGSLNDKQRKMFCFDFTDPLRDKVDNNWRITKARIGNDLSPDQQDLVRQIFLGLHSEQYADKVLGQVEHDNGKDGFKKCSLAMFGEPGSGKFEFVFTGRHVTRRCDGDSVEGAAFGGPIFYGHAAQGFNEKPDHPGNIYWYQALRANELYQALDGKQRKLALLGTARDERGTQTVALPGTDATTLPGLPFEELAKDQQGLLMDVMRDVLAPFRPADREESMKLIEQAGLENLHLSYYKNHDVGDDGVWDVWQVESPSMVWHFRGDPHVHTWVHIRQA